ncbi:helix-turn-helix domain-containing protein [Zavarzinia compransoris]|uniref:HTH araC/xylS-type domain-containing protein n=1 Tax=Zavarzinia compransoris TaxID=1264899 RepID=A0A317E4G9_9PROT|nr:AraC family transcriptional regulator [Zavarzinia compransoris]PWR22018.1 hypothetical protein DKG75_08550 [Zavarzinia compransoris]TDP47242.1 AraC-like DNA-binding protein [Zavarzinia compransoris]
MPGDAKRRGASPAAPAGGGPRWQALAGVERAAMAFQARLGRPWPAAVGPLELPAEGAPSHRDFARELTRYAVRLNDEGLKLLAEPIALGSFHLAADAVVGEPTLFDIWRKCARFNNTVTPAPPLSARMLGDRIALVWADAGPERAHPLFPFVQLLFFQRLTVWLTGQRTLDGTLHVPAAAAPFVDDWAGILRGRVERAEVFGFSIPGELAALPNIRDHRALAELASRPTEYMLFVDDEPGLTERVRRILRGRPGEIVALETVSDLLHISSRSLSRHLAAEGTNFSDLRTEIICEAAVRLLGRSTLPIAEIARHLGFAEAASFNRLFRRGTGMAPSACRRTLASTRIDDLP